MDNKSQEKNRYSKNIVRNTIIMFVLSLFIANILCFKGIALPWLDTESQWIGFLGSFLSSITTIVALYWTIEYTRVQAMSDREYSREQSGLDREYAEKKSTEERRFQHIPYLKILFEEITTDETINKTEHIIQLGKEYKYRTVKQIRLINVGIGPMIDLEISTEECELLLYPMLDIRDEENDVMEFRIINELQTCALLIFYKDLFSNKYKQSAVINFMTLSDQIYVFLSDVTEAIVVK